MKLILRLLHTNGLILDVVVVAVVVAPLFVYVCSLVSHFLPPTIIYAR